MWLDPLQDTKDCVVPFSLDLFHSGFQYSEEVLSRPPHGWLSFVLAFCQRVRSESILHLIEIVLHTFLIFRALVISIDERKSRPGPVIHARHEHRYLCLVYAVIQAGRFGTKWGKLEEFQIARPSQRLLVDLETLIFDKIWALFTCIERQVKFQCKILKSDCLFTISGRHGTSVDQIEWTYRNLYANMRF